MKERVLLYNQEARQKLKIGIDTLADMVKVTLGPKGNNVIIEKHVGGPLITKDGVTVAKEIFVKDPIENMGVQLLKEVALKTNETAGDGTTTATILAQALISEGIKNVTAGVNPMDLKRGMDIAVKEVVKNLKEIGKKVESKNDIIHVASISANNDYDTGNIIADAMDKAGEEGTIIVENSRGMTTEIEVAEGVQIDRGYKSSYFITKKQTMEVELQNVDILLYNNNLNRVTDLANIMKQSAEQNASLLVVADDFSDEVLKLLVLNHLKGNIKCCAVQSPGFGDRRVDLLRDIAVATGGKVIGSEHSITLDQVNITYLGGAKKVVIDKNKTVIIGGFGKQEEIKDTVDQIRYLIQSTETDFDKQRLQERLGKLTGGIVVLRVGSVTETELNEKKMRIEDALHATRAAIEEGIIVGGGVALLRVRQSLKDSSNLSFVKGNKEEQKIGISIVYKALAVPFLSICNNAGLTGEVLLTEIEKSKNINYGYDALNEKYGDLIELGVIDPVKVVRLALENAVSVAGMFLTTQGVISQSLAEKESIDKLMSQGPM